MGEIADTDDEDEGDGGAAGGNTAAQERALQGASMDVDAGGEGGAAAMAGGTPPPPPCASPAPHTPAAPQPNKEVYTPLTCVHVKKNKKPTQNNISINVDALSQL